MTGPQPPRLSSAGRRAVAQSGTFADGTPIPDEPRTGLHAVGADAPPQRRVVLEPASSIKPKRARWLWDRRIPVGELTLLAGREGIGKSSSAYTIAADVTRGRLEGEHEGRARAVAIAATEDSWAATIVPRLMAADADLNLIYRVEVVAAAGGDAVLTLPRDIDAAAEAMKQHDVAMLLLDPLMSRLAAALDTHKDSEVRQALEPLVKTAQTTGTAVVGIIHVSKQATKDPLTSIMGSRAFAAVARAVLFVMVDPDDTRVRLLGVAKSNLGPTDLPVLTFSIESHVVDHDPDDGTPISAGRVLWGQTRDESMAEVYESVDDVRSDVSRSDTEKWLIGLFADQGGSLKASEVFKRGKADGLAETTLRRVAKRMGVQIERKGFGDGSWWSYDPGAAAQPRSGHPSRGGRHE